MKKLTQAVFDLPRCPEWAASAVVDGHGRAWWFKVKSNDIPMHSDGHWFIPSTESVSSYIGSDYDTTNWQQSAIDRGEE